MIVQHLVHLLTSSERGCHGVSALDARFRKTHCFAVPCILNLDSVNDEILTALLCYMTPVRCAGGELFHYLDVEGSFTDNAARFYTANVLLALQHLHSKGILYRDLKPENLLVDRDGYVKVADFGFAKIISKEKTYTICGTPDYQVMKTPAVSCRQNFGVLKLSCATSGPMSQILPIASPYAGKPLTICHTIPVVRYSFATWSKHICLHMRGLELLTSFCWTASLKLP